MILYLKNGSGIHIKKKNRGKFTSYCGGNVTSACIAKAKRSGNPTLVKRATFAANARKWKHLNGGILLKYLIGGYVLPQNVLEALSNGSAAGGLLEGFGRVMNKILPTWFLKAGTYLSPLNYVAALAKGSINPKVGEEVISKWHPNLLLIARTGEAVFGGKAIKNIPKVIKNTPKAVVNTAAKAGVKPAKAAVVAREIKQGIKLNTKNGRIEVSPEYFKAEDKWYRLSERPEKIGIEEQGKNITTHDDPEIPGTIGNWRSTMLDNRRGLNGKGKRIVPRSDNGFVLEEGMNFAKHGQAHGNTSQAAKGLIWGGTFAFSNRFPGGIIEGQAPNKIFRGMTVEGKDSRSNFVLLNWEDVPIGARVGFHTGEMPMENLGWFLKTKNGTYTYESIIPEKRITYHPTLLLEPSTSLAFFERRPSKISLAERLGKPKGDRNNKKNINTDNIYGNLRFIRNIDGLPTVKDGLVQLGNSDKLLTNFTTDLPFRLHDWYPNISGSTYMIVSPRAFKGKKFYSIKPSDSFLSTVDSKVTPNQVRIISGDPKILEEAERRGMRTLTSDKLQNLFNVGSEITKKEFELGRNGAVRPFANADVAINDFKFRNHFYGENVPEILSKYPEGVVTPYRAEVDRLITQNIGRPSAKDYLVLENMTGLDAGIINKFGPELIKKAKDPLATRDMFAKVYYPVTSQIEEELMNSIGLYPGPYYSFSNLLKLNKLNGNPIKHKQGGKMNIIDFLKKGSGIHIKKENRGKFTDYCGGKVTSACIAKGKASSNPVIRKRATFAANARKWKHQEGGKLCLIPRN